MDPLIESGDFKLKTQSSSDDHSYLAPALQKRLVIFNNSPLRDFLGLKAACGLCEPSEIIRPKVLKNIIYNHLLLDSTVPILPISIKPIKTHPTFGSFDMRALCDVARKYQQNPIQSQSLLTDFGNQYGPYMDLALRAYTCFHTLLTAKDTCSLVLALTTFLNHYYSVSKVFQVIEIILGDDLLGFKPMFTKIGDADPQPIESQGLSETLLGGSRAFLDHWKALTGCDLLLKTTKVVYGLIASGLVKQFELDFNGEAYTMFSKRNVANNAFTSINDMLYSVVDLIVSFAETGYECFIEKSLRPALITDRVSRDWLTRVQVMYDKHAALPNAVNPDYPALLIELDLLVADGQRLMRTPNKTHLTAYFRPLMEFRIRFMKKHSVSSTRRCPFSVLIHGPPGIGKTSITNVVATIYAQTVRSSGLYPDLPWDPKENMYTYNPDDEYWSSYKGAEQWCIGMDDLARDNVSHVSKGIALSVKEVISIVNTVGMATNQASIEDKGVIPLLPKLVIATTNTKDLNARHAVADAAAILRRFPFVVMPIIKPEYFDESTGGVRDDMGVILDAWNFQVETVKVCPPRQLGGPSTIVYVPMLPGDNIATGAQFSQFLAKQINKHEARSTMMAGSLNTVSQMELCPHDVLTCFPCDDCGKVALWEKEHALDPITGPMEELEYSTEVLNHAIESLIAAGTPADDLTIEHIKDFCRNLPDHMPFISPRYTPVIQREDDTDSLPSTSEDSKSIESQSLCSAPIPSSWFYTIVMTIGWFGAIFSLISFLVVCFILSCKKTIRFFKRISEPLLQDMRVQALIFILDNTPLKYHHIVIEFVIHQTGQPAGLAAIATRALLERRIPPGLLRHQQAIKLGLGVVTGGMFITLAASLISRLRGVGADEPFMTDVDSQGNMWSAPPPSKFVLPKTSLKQNDDQIIISIKKSIFRLSVQINDAPNQSAFAFSLGEGLYATVGHIFASPQEKYCCVADIGQCVNNLKKQVSFTLSKTAIVSVEGDIVVFSSSKIIPRKSLKNFLPPLPDEVGRKVRTISLFPDGSLEVGHGVTTSPRPFKYQDPLGNTITATLYDGERYDRICRKGDCGTLVIAESAGGWFITSMHVAGSPNTPRLISQPLSAKMFASHFPQFPVANMGDYNLFEKGNARSGPLREPSTRSISAWITKGCGDHIGSYHGRSTMTSRVKETMICGDVCESFQRTNPLTQPLMKACQDPDTLEWKDPFTISAATQANTSPHFTDHEFEICSEEYLRPMLDFIREEEIALDMETVDVAINGNLKFDGLPLSTSGGFNFPGSKRTWLIEREDGSYEMGKEVQAAYDSILSAYERGEKSNTMFNGCLKDEPVSLKKRTVGKTRVFTASDLAFSIIVRQQYLRVAAFIMRHNEMSECAVTMNCYGDDWGTIYDHITKFGKTNLFDGDYTFFDKQMPAEAICAGFRVLDRLMDEDCPRTKRNVLICNGIKTDIMFPVVNMNGDVIMFYGSNSSGHCLTVIINSIVNSLYVRIAYFSLFEDIKLFRTYVSLITLGDDNVVNSARQDFNHTTLTKALQTKGIVYTMADKNAKSIPFKNVSDVSFLKRKFVVNPDGRVVAPIELDSVFKALCMEVCRDVISSEERLAQVYLSARREWSLHGEEIFNMYTSKMDVILARHPIVLTFCTNKRYTYNYKQTYEWTVGIAEEEEPPPPSLTILEPNW